MRKTIILFLIILTFSSCSWFNVDKNASINPEILTHPINSSIRAIEAVDENTCWFAGSGGIVGHTNDGGQTWITDTIIFEGMKPEFRAIAVIDNAVLILSVASPALLFKSTDGQSWELVFREDHPSSFYNAMTFWDSDNGIAVGDPIDGCLSVITSNDGGNSWQKISCDLLPQTIEGEAGFAASNTNIEVLEDQTWIVSGGKAARVFYSPDKGKSWQVFDTPINQGKQMTGIFSIDFYDDQHGIIWGGDWDNQTNNNLCKAITNDGGKTWQLLNSGMGPGYRSCVQYVPQSHRKEIFAVGIPGVTYSSDGGQKWEQLSDSSFYTIRINKSGNSAWLAGKNKLGKMNWY